jgi:integrase
MGSLTDRAVKTLGAGRHGDGDGLNLLVSSTGRRRWILRYQLRGGRHDMGLGSYPAVSLAEARIAAADARKRIASGLDPIEARRVSQKIAKPVPTFAEIASIVVSDAQRRSTNEKVRYQWARHLGPAFCSGLLDRPVNEITTLDVAATLKELWHSKPEVARKLYPAIRRVFDLARVKLRDDHGVEMLRNPADWSDLKALGFEPPRLLSRGRFPALPYPGLPQFMEALRAREALTARALEFLILTNVRTDAILEARWDDIDIAMAIWTVPLGSLKDRRYRTEGFRIPLSTRAMELLLELIPGKSSRLIFPGRSPDQPLSNMALLSVIRRMNNVDKNRWTDPASGRGVTAHGFRATFRTWAEECVGFPHAVIEEAMGHQVGSQVERAYRRTDVLEQRRKLMETWALFCDGSP